MGGSVGGDSEGSGFPQPQRPAAEALLSPDRGLPGCRGRAGSADFRGARAPSPSPAAGWKTPLALAKLRSPAAAVAQRRRQSWPRPPGSSLPARSTEGLERGPRQGAGPSPPHPYCPASWSYCPSPGCRCLLGAGGCGARRKVQAVPTRAAAAWLTLQALRWQAGPARQPERGAEGGPFLCKGSAAPGSREVSGQGSSARGQA